MDPQAALTKLLAALHNVERDEVLEALESLQGWVERGGAIPHIWPLREVVVDLELHASKQGPGPDKRLAEFKAFIGH